MNMDIFNDKELCEVVSVDDDTEFIKFLSSNPHGITFVPEKYRECEDLVMKKSAGHFSKWLKKNNPNINVMVCKTDKKILLRSNDLWLPLVFIASDVTIQVYLNLVANYIYDWMKGALRGEKSRVHLEAIYKDKSEGITKKFNFEGDIDGLQKAIKQFDLNKFMEK